MIREIVHFFRYVPEVVWLSTQHSQSELFDLLMERSERAGFAKWRAALVAGLEGRVLEFGCGTGRMFPYYSGDIELVALEPFHEFIPLAKVAATRANVPTHFIVGSGEHLPFPDDHFDALVMADVLCSVKNTPRLLAEARRVLRRGGELRITTHVISKRFLPRILMHLFNPPYRLYNHQGCNMNRDTERDLQAADFEFAEVQPYQIFTRGLPAFPGLYIRAVPKPRPTRIPERSPSGQTAPTPR